MYCDENCSLTTFVNNEPWCSTHERNYLLPMWKVEVTGDTADNSFGNLFSDDLFMVTERVSPIVVYSRMSYASANELAKNPDFEVNRAAEGWRI